MLNNQKHKFSIPENVTYLNMAYMSPLLHEVAEAGRHAVDQKRRPFEVIAKDFFEPVTELKSLYSKLIECPEPERICMIPSVSYGIATVINNIKLNPNDEIIVLEEQFPSNIYSWKRLAETSGAKLKIISKPQTENRNVAIWNQHIMEAINENTKVVSICQTHWADGSLFDLKSIRKKTNAVGALLIIDGTQSVGAYPFSVEEIQPDALICAAYKWLMGPYASGLAYYGPYFDDGIPIEENWSNRLNSENFAGLTSYETNYKPFANRYNVGEQANFIAVPMLKASIKQLLDWTPHRIQAYCAEIAQDALESLLDIGCKIESSKDRGHHLFGIKLPGNTDLKQLKAEFDQQKIFVSIRGDYVRVSPHLYNTKRDMETLVHAIKLICS